MSENKHFQLSRQTPNTAQFTPPKETEMRPNNPVFFFFAVYDETPPVSTNAPTILTAIMVPGWQLKTLARWLPRAGFSNIQDAADFIRQYHLLAFGQVVDARRPAPHAKALEGLMHGVHNAMSARHGHGIATNPLAMVFFPAATMATTSGLAATYQNAIQPLKAYNLYPFLQTAADNDGFIALARAIASHLAGAYTQAAPVLSDDVAALFVDRVGGAAYLQIYHDTPTSHACPCKACTFRRYRRDSKIARWLGRRSLPADPTPNPPAPTAA